MGMLVNRVGREAEDLYQETWVKVSQSLHTYDERGPSRPGCFRSHDASSLITTGVTGPAWW